MTIEQGESIVAAGVSIVKALEPLEPILVGIGEAVLATFKSHAAVTLTQIEAEWVANEIASAALMKPNAP